MITHSGFKVRVNTTRIELLANRVRCSVAVLRHAPPSHPIIGLLTSALTATSLSQHILEAAMLDVSATDVRGVHLDEVSQPHRLIRSAVPPCTSQVHPLQTFSIVLPHPCLR